MWVNGDGLLDSGTSDPVVLSWETRYRVPKREKRRGRRRGVGRRGKGGRGCYPALARLGIVHGATPALMSEVGWHAA